LPAPVRSSSSRRPAAGASTACPTGLPRLATVPADLQAQHSVLRRPDRQDRRARPALRRGVRSRPCWPPSWSRSWFRALVPRWTRRCATSSGSRCACAARSPEPTAARPGGPRIWRCPRRPGESLDHRPAQQATAGRPDHLDAVAGRHQWPIRDQRRRRPALDDRFAEGGAPPTWRPTDPGADSGAAAGLHALVGGSMVSMDGQKAPRLPGSFGQMPNQTSAALSRSGQEAASVVTLRPGAPDMASSLWVGPVEGDASQALDGRTFVAAPPGRSTTRSWVVVDGNNVCGSSRSGGPGSPRGIPSTQPPCPRVSRTGQGAAAVPRTGRRAAMVIEARSSWPVSSRHRAGSTH